MGEITVLGGLSFSCTSRRRKDLWTPGTHLMQPCRNREALQGHAGAEGCLPLQASVAVPSSVPSLVPTSSHHTCCSWFPNQPYLSPRKCSKVGGRLCSRIHRKAATFRMPSASIRQPVKGAQHLPVVPWKLVALPAALAPWPEQGGLSWPLTQ